MQQHTSAVRRTFMLVGLTIALGCGGAAASGPDDDGSGNPPPPPPPSNTVRVTNNAFTPGSITVARGAVVTWDWDTCSGSDPYGAGETCVSHSVVMDDGSATSATQSKGSYAQQFNTTGTYAYHCAVHGATMSGKVVVQ
jgi:plastocyanin